MSHTLPIATPETADSIVPCRGGSEVSNNPRQRTALLTVNHSVLGSETGEGELTAQRAIFTSLTSLGWGASRAFFLSRKHGHIDPEPPLRMMRIVFPLMIIVVTNNLIMWTFVGGLLSRATPVAIIVNFFTVFSALRFLTLKPENSKESFVLLRASVFAVWLPCVVSDRTDRKNRPNLFWITALVTLTTKIVLAYFT